MLVKDFSDTVKYELQQCKTEEQIHDIAKRMISIIKGHEIVTISNLDVEDGQ